MSRVRRIGLGLLVSALVLVLIEGVASWLVFGWEARMHLFPPIPERAHTVYDAELGWVSANGKVARDVYGPGLHITTNAQGFRGTRDYAREVPAGTTRVVALGDSFTLGFGLGDADSWPARLERACPRVEAPNMGQSGYGIDQDYLWYARDGGSIEHQVLVLAFIDHDLDRVRAASMLGYGKPVLRLVNGALETRNVPVPRSGYLWPFLTQNLKLVAYLRSVELARKLSERLGPAPVADPYAISDAETLELDLAIVAALRKTAAERGAALALAHLPHLELGDPSRLGQLLDWERELLARVAASGVPVFDLAEELSAVPDPRRRDYFQSHTLMRGAAGHYSPAGNDFIARAIAARLQHVGLLPEAACRPAEN